MIVTLTGFPDGKPLAFNTGHSYFVPTVKVPVMRPPIVIPREAVDPADTTATEDALTFQFSHRDVTGQYFYKLLES